MGPDPRGDDRPLTREDLERAILRESPIYTAAEVSGGDEEALEESRRLWRALGFPEYPGEEVAFTKGDAGALATLRTAVASGVIDFDTALNLTRAVGQTMARLADWEVATLLPRLDQRMATGENGDSRLAAAIAMVEQVNGPFEALLVYAWRRHLAAAVSRVEALGSADEDLKTTEVTVGFADIVQFTALSNEIGEERVGDLVEVFESRCSDVVAAHRGRIIKSLGDSVLFIVDDAVRGLDIAEGIIQVIGRDARMPDVRVGLASGSVVMRLGDVFGPPVNMAARLTAVARRNRVIIDEATAALLPDDQFETRRLPARPVRGFGLVEPIAVRRQ
ncbi:adenylate/guanylate cyclase domain-containing protein [Nocardioides guangzhouensis]|uniref:Adenylate/guanylate cyclase domain-containing protein n=1 Tax=Nocardioides guangzhouensis TaxID=2497878 RepID=A0A4Q4Z7B8_9ACTN|nr:adenylate/guanylate cyclase domain-containing protein [Nocardioides guangzhouensis]RYP83398.1 adenylate/guanylate cyclase domain-containing protein [Nocardioides guangzhouensis]